MSTTKRTFLLLQGVCSPFFRALATALEHQGFMVLKVNFNAGDQLFWLGKPALNFRGKLTDLPDWLDDVYRQYQVTDQILFGDQRPVHLLARSAADQAKVTSHVYEEGYFRPYWVTLERGGVNADSALPINPDWYQTTAASLPALAPISIFPGSFARRAFYDVIYHLAGAWNWLLFPHYCTHAPMNAAKEYLGYIRRLPMQSWHQRRDALTLQKLVKSGRRYYFLPLQLSSDAQIRKHSGYADMPQVIQAVVASFASFAPPDVVLLLKNHPLDVGWNNYPALLRELSVQYQLGDRLLYTETGDLDLILQNCQGCVTVNSTVGALSLAAGKPTIALGKAIYALPGLTFAGALDQFWLQGAHPDQALWRSFQQTVLQLTQLNGGFYCDEGIKLAVQHSLPWLMAEYTTLEPYL